MSVLDINKTVIYEYYYDYVKPRYENSKIMLYEYR